MLITFEGIDASGKSTQLKLVADWLTEKGVEPIITRQPGGTVIGQKIREILLDPQNTQMVPTTEVLLYMADRIQHIQELIVPALQQNKIVLCDRYHDATLAYQGGGRQLDLSWLKPLEDQYLLKPDLTLWFDISVKESQDRLTKRNTANNENNCRLESENEQFFTRVRDAYQTICREHSERIVCINGEGEINIIQEGVQKIVMATLKI